jgi:hypothetical protein
MMGFWLICVKEVFTYHFSKHFSLLLSETTGITPGILTLIDISGPENLRESPRES